MENRNVILHLSLIDGIGSRTIQKIIKECAKKTFSLVHLYGCSMSEIEHMCLLSKEKASLLYTKLQDRRTLEKELALIEKEHIYYTTLIDQEYPPQLAAIHAPPPVLYWKGNTPFSIPLHSLAVVGSRAMDAYGKYTIEQLLPSCIQQEIPIISGGAYGVDTEAHVTALRQKGTTIAVLGSGLLHPYPFSNRKLFEKIYQEHGYVISCFPLETKPVAGNFPARNRIIAGLTHATLVVQASAKSGALITAAYALEEGRTVMAVPGRINDELSVGCNRLIKQGAYPIICAEDILQLFGIHALSFANTSTASILDQVENKIQKEIILVLQQSPSSFEELLQKIDCSIQVLQKELFALECKKIIEQNFTDWKIAYL